MIEASALQHWAEWIASHQVEEFKFVTDRQGRLQMVLTFAEGTRQPYPSQTHFGNDWDLRTKSEDDD